MKKKLLAIFLGIALFIPMSIVNASDITIDQIITELGNRLSTDKLQVEELKIEKESTDTIKVSTKTTLNLNGVDTDVKSYITYSYAYGSSVLSHRSDYWYAPISDETTERVFAQNKEITKELTIAMYKLKGYQNDDEIVEYLKNINILDNNGQFIVQPRTKSAGIETIITDELSWMSDYNIYADEISITDNQNNNQQNNNQQNNKKEYTLAKNGDAFIISFVDDENIDYSLSMNMYSDEYDEFRQEDKDFFKEHGELLDIYSNILILDHNNMKKDEGSFTIKIKMTEKMKKYNTFELVGLEWQDDNPIWTKYKMTKDGEYLITEIPKLKDFFSLAGRIEDIPTSGTVENPKTGAKNSETLGLITIITLSGTYLLLKKKMSN